MPVTKSKILSANDYPKNEKQEPVETIEGVEETLQFFINRGNRDYQEDSLVYSKFAPKDLAHLDAEAIALCLWQTHKKLDRDYAQQREGSTAATTAYDGKGNIVTASLADSSSFAVMYDVEGQPIDVICLNPVRHKPRDPKEITRLKNMGASLIGNRVYIGNVGLLVSRAIGDKNKGEPSPAICSDSNLTITSIDELIANLPENSECHRIELISTSDGFTDAALDQSPNGQAEFLLETIRKIKAENKSMTPATLFEYSGGTRRDNTSIAVQPIYENKTAYQFPILVGVYDGHGGADVSSNVANHISETFLEQCELAKNPEYLPGIVKENQEALERDHADEAWYLKFQMESEEIDHLIREEKLDRSIFEPYLGSQQHTTYAVIKQLQQDNLLNTHNFQLCMQALNNPNVKNNSTPMPVLAEITVAALKRLRATELSDESFNIENVLILEINLYNLFKEKGQLERYNPDSPIKENLTQILSELGGELSNPRLYTSARVDPAFSAELAEKRIKRNNLLIPLMPEKTFLPDFLDRSNNPQKFGLGPLGIVTPEILADLVHSEYAHGEEGLKSIRDDFFRKTYYQPIADLFKAHQVKAPSEEAIRSFIVTECKDKGWLNPGRSRLIFLDNRIS